jgi:ABC-type transporter Mla subunit MlaD
MSFLLTLLALIVALGVWGVAGMGIGGKGRTRHPRLAHHFARAAQVLNGDR